MADGLKKLRAKTGKAPTYECSNCKCKRYSPCRCMKKGDVIDIPQVPQAEPQTEATPEQTPEA